MALWKSKNVKMCWKPEKIKIQPQPQPPSYIWIYILKNDPFLILQESSNSENSKLKSKKKTNKISQKKVFFRFFGKTGTFYKFEISEIVKCVP